MPDETAAATPAAQPKKPFDPERPDPKAVRRCRSLTTRGIQCRQSAMRGFDYCCAHFNRGPIILGKPGHITVPLLEDHSAIQLMCTRICHAALNKEIDPVAARHALSACKIAAFTLPRPPRIQTPDKPEPIPEAVSNFHADEYGSWIGPREEYRGPTGTFEPQWSFSKYMYERDCEELGQIKPTCAADFPASGWLTEEEMKETPEQWKERTKGRQLALYEKCKAAEKAANPERFYLPSPETKGETKSAPKTEPSTKPNLAPNPEPGLEPNPAPSAARNPEPRDKNNPDTPKPTAHHHQPCPCGGLYGGDPCDECLDRQQRSAPPATDYTPYTGSFDLKASAEAESCSPDRSTLNAKRCPDRFDVVEVVNKPNPMIPKARKITHKGGTLSRRPKCTKTTATLPLLSLDESATRFFASGGPEVGFEIRLRKNLVTPEGV
jgi:hypothetical protein